MNTYKIWAIVLAAGASTRMKKQKMLLPFHGKTIIETVVEKCIALFKQKVIVVLGSHRREILKQVQHMPVTFGENKKYQTGMLSSVIKGISCLPDGATGFMVFLGDQPQIPVEAAKQVIQSAKQSEKGIIIPVFNSKRGHPVLIDIKYKNEIEKLDPEKGLRELMVKFENDILETECFIPEILRDIDTPQDYVNETKLK